MADELSFEETIELEQRVADPTGCVYRLTDATIAEWESADFGQEGCQNVADTLAEMKRKETNSTSARATFGFCQFFVPETPFRYSGLEMKETQPSDSDFENIAEFEGSRRGWTVPLVRTGAELGDLVIEVQREDGGDWIIVEDMTGFRDTSFGTYALIDSEWTPALVR